MLKKMDEQRLQLLLDRYFDQLLAANERKELELALLASSRAREMFWDAARTHALIRNWGEAEWGRQEALMEKLQPATPFTHRSPRLSRLRRPGNLRRALIRWLLPACATVLMVFGVIIYRKISFHQETAAHRGIAVLTLISEVEWADNRESFQPGEALRPGWLRLDRGAVQIEFSRGARVVLEGPAELQLVSESEAFLRRGKLSAHVPPLARGFTIGTADFAVVDHGTEFGCIVDSTNSAEVHVFSGKVSYHPSATGQTSIELKKNQALRLSQQLVQAIPADHTKFLSEAALARLDAAREGQRLSDWRAASDMLRNNPNTLVYFDFEPSHSDPRVLPNRAQNAPANSDASIIGCDPVEGRWQNKPALEFKRPDDRVRLTVPGEFKALTFLAWIRVDDLASRQQALAMSESFLQGEIHWYLYRNGSLSLAEHIKTNSASRGWRDFRSPSVMNSDNYDNWVMVASVCDSTTGEIRHYFNGQQLGIGYAGQNYRAPMRLDTFEIGNWGVRYNDPRWSFIEWGSPNDAVRNFRGRMDEFAILSTALSSQEIQKLYRQGRPGETVFATSGQ